MKRSTLFQFAAVCSFLIMAGAIGHLYSRSYDDQETSRASNAEVRVLRSEVSNVNQTATQTLQGLSIGSSTDPLLGYVRVSGNDAALGRIKADSALVNITDAFTAEQLANCTNCTNTLFYNIDVRSSVCCVPLYMYIGSDFRYLCAKAGEFTDCVLVAETCQQISLTEFRIGIHTNTVEVVLSYSNACLG